MSPEISLSFADAASRSRSGNGEEVAQTTEEPSARAERAHYIVIPPQELMKRLTKIHGHDERIHTYFWVTSKGLCWEGRGLGRSDERSMAEGHYQNPERDFTKHLDAWRLLETRLSARSQTKVSNAKRR